MKCCWNRTMLNLCGIVATILKMATGRNFSMSGINSGHHYLPTYISNVDDTGQCWIVAVLWRPFWKWRPVEIFHVGTSLSTHISNFDDIGQYWIFTAHFLYRILAAILKMADISKFWKCRIAPLMVTYHYVKFYVSFIIHLEVININVRNFNFPIGFYSNLHPLWTPKNMALTPFTANLKNRIN